MKKRSRRSRLRQKRPKRSGPRHRSQRDQKLSKQVRELYPPGAGDASAAETGAWEEELEGILQAPQPKGGGRRKPPDEPPRPEPAASGSEPAPQVRRGCVVSPSSGACRVESGGRRFECILPSRLAQDQQRRLAAGDEVLFEPHGPETYRVREVLPRRSTLSRPDPQNLRRERVIAANVDVVVQVVSVREPPLRATLIDRCLIAVERGGAAGLICVNKVDLLRDEEERRHELAALEPYQELGCEVIACSARTGEGVATIRRRLAGSTAVFVGHSGVGKSSLLNALHPGLDLRTGEVGAHGRGRHTTTRSHLYRLEGGIRVIDTPGIREFGLFELTADELPAYFPDLQPHAARCRFNDCRHLREPDCAVRAAVAAGEVAEARYRTYLRILESLADDAPG